MNLVLILLTVTLILLAIYVTLGKKTGVRAKSSAPTRVESIFIELSDCEVHYTRRGAGEPLILLHGWGANIFCWRFLTPLLEKKYTVYELDLPGFGHSTKITSLRYGLDDQCRRIGEFMDRLGMENAFFVGSSMGGALSLWMSVEYPQKVKKIVALAPAANKKVLPASLHYFATLGHFTPAFVSQNIGRYSLRNVISRKELIDNEMVEGYLNVLSQPGSSVTLIKALEALRDPRLPSGLSRVKTPVKILYGEKDSVVKRQFIDEVLDYLPHETPFKTHPTAGHHTQEDEPQWVYEEILSFFDV